MTHSPLAPFVLLLALAGQSLIIALAVSIFIKKTNKNPITMPDILYLLASVGFFALMLAFIWACEKV